MQSYLLIIAATLLLALEFAISKRYQASVGTSATAGLFFNAANGFFTVIVFFAINGFKLSVTPYSLIMASLMALFAASYVLIGFKVLKAGGVSLYTMFLMTGGMLLPYLWGTVRLAEEFSALRLIGLLLIIGAVVLTNLSHGVRSKYLIALCVAVFVLNGLVSIVSKEHQIEGSYPTVSSPEFVLLSGAAKLVLSTAALLFVKRNDAPSGRTLVRTLPLVILAAAIGGVSYLLQLIGARDIPATMLYPCVTGGSVIFSALAGMIFFGEMPTKRGWLAIAICFIGTCLFI